MAPASASKSFKARAKKKKEPPPSRGSLRFLADKRQITGLLTLLGFCAVIQPLAGLAGAIGPDGVIVSYKEDKVAFFGFVGMCCLVAVGGIASMVGYLENVLEYGNRKLTIASIVITQTAFVPYVSAMVAVGMTAKSGVGFIPEAYDPDPADVKFVGAMGILGIICYGFAMVGSISFFLFSLYAFQVEKPEARNGLYYKGRLRFYSLVLYAAGVSQLALAIYIYFRFDELGQMAGGPIVVAFYVINQPVLAGVVGIIQVVAGAWGFARTVCKCSEDNGKMFQGVMAVSWIAQLALQAITNNAYSPGGAYSGNAPSVAALSLALSLMPSYLDYKTNTVPEEFEPSHYGPDEVEVEPDPEAAPPRKKNLKAAGLAVIAARASQSQASSQMSETVAAMEKKQKALERSLVRMSKKQSELEKSIVKSPSDFSMSNSQLSMSASGGESSGSGLLGQDQHSA